jgi:hypothetical protein
MATDDKVHDEVSACNETLTSLFNSLTAQPASTKKTNDSHKKDKQPPLLASSDRRSMADVGNYLANPECEIGIDCMSVTFQFRNFIIDNPKDWEKGPKELSMDREYGKWSNRYPINPEVKQGDVFFTAEVIDGWGRGSIEIKPSTILIGPKSLVIATVDEALRLLRYAYDLVGQWLELVQPFETLTLTRVDLAYDVDKVADVQRLLQRVVYFPHNSQVSIRPILKGAGRWESVIVRSETNGGFIVYDKTRQCKKGDSVVRFEANVRSKVLKKHCLTVSQLTEASANNMFRHFFKRLIKGFSETVETPLEGPLSDSKHKMRTVEYVGIKCLQRAGYHVTYGSTRDKGFKELNRMGIGNAIEAMLDNMGR